MTAVSPTLPSAFTLQSRGELVAITGGGGKTSLMFALAAALPGRVVTTTTTRIFAAQMRLSPVTLTLADQTSSAESWRLADGRSLLSTLQATWQTAGNCLIVGPVAGEKAQGVPPALPGWLLAQDAADFVLVEADGSRMRPIKAPAQHEPAAPPQTTVLVPVVGIDALNGRLAAVAHRPERVAALIDCPSPIGNYQLATGDVAKLLTHAQGGLKGAPDGARVIPLLNKVETPAQLAAARQIARLALREPRISQVVIGAVQRDRPVREIHRRVTAVVLAAGEAKRMGQTKQLLPWGERTVLGQVLVNLEETAVHDTLVVTGHEAEKVAAVARRHGASAVHNPDYAAGEMLSSLQTAVRRLPNYIDAVLVMLADQPLVRPATIDRILAAYWGGIGELFAPAFQGQRGNPVLIGRPFFAELLALPPGAAPRLLLRRHPERLHLVEVESDAVLVDLDRPEEYQRRRPT